MSSAAEPRGFAAYIAGTSLWYAATGMQAVLFSWLVVGALGAPAELVGVVQMAHVLPVLALLLLGGATADRVDRRKLLLALHVAAGVLACALAAAVLFERLTLAVLVTYAVGMGSVTAFAMPARDAVLSDVAPRGDLMRAATALTLAQFSAQAVGTLLAGIARYAAVGPALGVQALLMLVGAVAVWKLPRSEPRPDAARTRPAPRELLEGLAEVARSPSMRATMLLLSGVGLFLAGAYFVVVPVMVRDVYGGDVAELSLFMGALQIGTVLGASFMLTLRRLPPRGPALAASLAATTLPLFALSFAVPFPGALACAFFWGLCVAAFNSIGRGIMQESAPAAHRARVLAVFSLGVMGAGVLGAPVAGFVAGTVGPLGALTFAGAAMLAFVAGVTLVTGARRMA